MSKDRARSRAFDMADLLISQDEQEVRQFADWYRAIPEEERQAFMQEAGTFARLAEFPLQPPRARDTVYQRKVEAVNLYIMAVWRLYQLRDEGLVQDGPSIREELAGLQDLLAELRQRLESAMEKAGESQAESQETGAAAPGETDPGL